MPEWVRYRWASLARIFVATLRDSQTGRLLAVTPLVERRYPLTFSIGGRELGTMQVAGLLLNGNVPLFPEHEESYEQLLRAALAMPSVNCIYMLGIPKHSPFWTFLVKARERHPEWLFYTSEGERSRYLFVDMNLSYQEYLKRFKATTLRVFGRRLRQLGKAFERKIEVVRIRDVQDVPEFLDAARTIAQKSWQRKLIDFDVGQDAYRQEMLEEMARLGVLRSYLFKSGDRSLAYILGFQLNGTFYFQESAYDPDAASFSPGVLLHFFCIKDCFEVDKPSMLHFGTGEADYKKTFADRIGEETSLIIVNGKGTGWAKVTAHRIFRTAMTRLKAARRPSYATGEATSKRTWWNMINKTGRHGRLAIGWSDVQVTAILLAMGLVSWLCPIDRLLSAARLLRKLKPSRVNGQADAASAASLPPVLAMQQSAHVDRLYEARMQMLALHRPRRRWKPNIRWHGLEYLQAALDRGSGAILWDGNFVYRTLITKMAFQQAGYPFVQLSRQGHGFSDTPYGIRYLNPYAIAIEDRYLAERIFISDDQTLDHLRKRLAENKVVGILVWHKGRRTVEVPFLKEGAIRIATGPIYLSHTSGAPLIPVFTTRDEDGVYDLTVGPPLDVPAASEVPSGFRLDYKGIVRSYVNMLEPHVLRHPDQFNGLGYTAWGSQSAPASNASPERARLSA
jgi:lauroyl/myristoyl acyltransferase